MSKRLEGRDEPILDPDIPIIDAHHHLWDHPTLRYLLKEYLDDARAGHNIIASVYVEALSFYRADGPEVLRPLGEIEFANGLGAMCASGQYGDIRLCAAIVGHADLRMGDRVRWLLDRALSTAPERFRGIRQITMDHPSDAPYRYFSMGRPPVGILEHPEFRHGFKQLAQRNLIYDAAVFHLQLPRLSALCDAFPGTTVVVNHMSVAMGLEMNAQERKALFREWYENLRDTAQRPNAVCKIGGLGMPIWGFGFHKRKDVVGYKELAEMWRPFVESAIELFGTNRCMMESNFPPNGRSSGYVPTWNALKHIVSGASAEEKADLFHKTASRVYRIDLPFSEC